MAYKIAGMEVGIQYDPRPMRKPARVITFQPRNSAGRPKIHPTEPFLRPGTLLREGPNPGPDRDVKVVQRLNGTPDVVANVVEGSGVRGTAQRMDSARETPKQRAVREAIEKAHNEVTAREASKGQRSVATLVFDGVLVVGGVLCVVGIVRHFL